MAANMSGPTVLDVVSDYFGLANLKAMLVTSGFVFDKNVHAFRSDVTNELAGGGYTAGGVDLTTVGITHDAANSRVNITADEAEFGVLTQADISGLVVYVDTGLATTDRILSVHTFATQAPNGMYFTYFFPSRAVARFNF